MKELSLNILDIAENSVKAKATLITITLDETETTLRFTITDNGCGMKPEFLRNVTNPYCTTRTTRPVGMGISFLKLAAEQTGGDLTIESVHEELSEDHGTTLSAFFHTDHIDFEPLGDIVSTITTLIHGSPNIDFVFEHTHPKGEISLDTRQLREVLGEVPLDSAEVIAWIGEFLREQYTESGYAI